MFFTRYPRAYPAEPMNRIVEPILKERSIEVLTVFDLDHIDPDTRTLTSIEGDVIECDLPIVIPPFVGGDATSLPTSKSGVGAHLEAKVVARTLSGAPAVFEGRTHCPFDVAGGRGHLRRRDLPCTGGAVAAEPDEAPDEDGLRPAVLGQLAWRARPGLRRLLPPDRSGESRQEGARRRRLRRSLVNGGSHAASSALRSRPARDEQPRAGFVARRSTRCAVQPRPELLQANGLRVHLQAVVVKSTQLLPLTLGVGLHE